MDEPVERPYRFWLAALVSLGIGGISLVVLPDGVGYDPWSWLVWGRELSHLTLTTAGAASSVKPLPMFIDAFLAFTGPAAPDLWLVVARGGAVMAILLAYRLGSRLGGRGAGIIAALGLLTSYQLLGYLVLDGMSEPLGAAFALAAVEAHLDRRRWAALWLGLGAALVRVEVVAFMAVYGAFWIVRPSGYRRLVMAGVALILVIVPLAWFLPDLISAGSLLRSASRATYQTQGGPLVNRYPGLATFKEGAGLMIIPVSLAFAVETLIGLVELVRDRTRVRPTLPLALIAIAWVVVEAVMAQLHVATGAPRYLLTFVGLGTVVAGTFWANAARWAAERFDRRRVRVTAAGLVCAVLVAASVTEVINLIDRVEGGVKDNTTLAELSHRLPHVIDASGGRDKVISCAPVYTVALENPALAWALRVPLAQIHIDPGPKGTLFSLGPQRPGIAPANQDNYKPETSALRPGATGWQVLTTCKNARS